MVNRIKIFEESSQNVVGVYGSINEVLVVEKNEPLDTKTKSTLSSLRGKCVVSVIDSNLASFNTKIHSMVLDISGEDELQRFYKAISKDGKVKFELQETSLGVYQAIFSDSFGVTWNLKYSVDK
ncbi:MAG: hypothetical protein PHD88_02740 [Firmicutes bacterium]|nr:hypothetical protein [Bacillota bacterium]MDD4263216.1 hypothetical protein [Bacillota bacterium]MDD4693309.1 hypothetical protein [Bacillota bacterium]